MKKSRFAIITKSEGGCRSLSLHCEVSSRRSLVRHATFFFLVLAVWSLWYAPTSQATTLAQSPFDTGTEGWSVVDLVNPLTNPLQVAQTLTPTFHTSGGNPGGFISMTDPGPNYFWFSAPTTFLGNQSSAFGDALHYDLAVININALMDGQFSPAVALLGANLTLFYSTPPPTDVFSTFTIPLTPTGWRVGDALSGPQPTNAEMQLVLGNLDALYISGDWLTGIEDAQLDNVILSGNTSAAVPEPSTWLLFMTGFVGLLGYGWRCRQHVA